MFKFKSITILSLTLSISMAFLSKSSASYDPEEEQLREVLEASRLASERASTQNANIDPEEAQFQEALRLSMLAAQPRIPAQQGQPYVNDRAYAAQVQRELEQQNARDMAELAYAEQLQRELDAESAAAIIEANKNAIPNLPILNFIPAIGQVIVQYESGAYHCGTGTLIEPNIVISAAHVFHRVLPAANTLRQQNGPVLIDLRGRGVTWNNAPVRSMVVDAKYIHLLHELAGRDPTEKITRYDMVFLMLENSMPATHPTIPLIGRVNNFYQMCALYGYGQLENAQRPELHRIAMKLDVDPEMVEYDVIRLLAHNNLPWLVDQGQLKGDVQQKWHFNKFEVLKELAHLFCKRDFDTKDGIVSGSPPGDSGGPMLVMTPEGVRIAGILCTYGVDVNPMTRQADNVNCCASLIKGQNGRGYSLNAWVPVMLNFLKRGH